MMEENQFDGRLRVELREYFKKRSMHLDKFARMRKTIGEMSPKLAMQAVEALHGKHFHSISWLRDLASDPSKIHGQFFIHLVDHLVCQLYCPAEPVAVFKTLVFVLHGTAILRGEGVVVNGSV